MHGNLIEFVSEHAFAATLAIVVITALGGALCSIVLWWLYRSFPARHVKLLTGIGVDLLLVGAIVGAASDLHLRRLEERTKDVASKLEAVLSTEAAMIAGSADECRLAHVLLAPRAPDQAQSNRGGREGAHPLHDQAYALGYTSRPTNEECADLSEVSGRALHGYSIVQQLIDPATSELERPLLWSKMQYITGAVDEYPTMWTPFTERHKRSRTGFIGGQNQNTALFDLLQTSYREQVRASRRGVPKGLWEVLGFLAVILKIGESLFEFRSSGTAAGE